jgi:hypothetical protein
MSWRASRLVQALSFSGLLMVAFTATPDPHEASPAQLEDAGPVWAKLQVLEPDACWKEEAAWQKEFPAVARLTQVSLGASKIDLRPNATATWVGSQAFLTAAHNLCVDGYGVDHCVTEGAKGLQAALVLDGVDVSATCERHPDYSAADLVLCKTDIKASRGAQNLRLGNIADRESVETVGFGQKPLPTGSGLLTLTLALAEVLGSDECPAHQPWARVLTPAPGSEGELAGASAVLVGGDSGGPVFARQHGKRVVVGVASGNVDCDSGSGYSLRSVAAVLEATKTTDWVKEWARDERGAPICGVNAPTSECL